MGRQAGFTLVEIVATVVLVGVIAVFGGFFLITGMRGEIQARQAAMDGQKADMALERIAIELRDADGLTGPGTAIGVDATPPTINYHSAIAALGSATAASRSLAYESANQRITLTPAGGTAQPLIDRVSGCTMTFAGSGAAATLTVSFTMVGSPARYTITIKPRGNTVTPVNI